jgi:hypothetical protein
MTRLFGSYGSQMFNISKVRFFLAVFGVCTLVQGCANITAPQYQVSKTVNETLSINVKTKVGVGDFSRVDAPDNKEAISLRSVTMISAHGGSYAQHLKEAVTRELKLADVFDPMSKTKIHATLLKNDLDASGINIGNGSIEAEFKVTDTGSEVFRRIYRHEHQWESSFMGIEAVQKAISQYQVLVERLIGKLVNDKEFLNALNR